MAAMGDRPRVGISACLLGAPVRYDAGHKRDPILLEAIGPYVEWVPVCPEAEAGFGTPRDPMRLVRTQALHGRGERIVGEDVALVVIRTGADVTDRLRRYAGAKLEALARLDLSGYILKADSPSCGMEGVKIYTADAFEPAGRGLFARALMAQLPTLPVEDERRLGEPRVRADFLERVFAYRQRAEG